MAGPFLVGVDVGTTSVKAALFDARGLLLAQRSSLIATRRPGPGLVEQAPEDWVLAMLGGLSAVLDGVPIEAVEGVGLCSQVNSHVFVDANGNALAPAIIWQDGRCAEDAFKLDRLVSDEARMKWWGAPLPIDSSHTLSRMAWMARVHPEVWRRTRWVMAPKDYCLLTLIGEACADPLSSFGVVDSSLRYIEELIALVPGAVERLPPLLGPAAVAGRIRPGLPGAGRAVAAATMDAWTGMVGLGAVRQGDAGYLSGTSEVVGIVSERRLPTSGVIAFPRCEGITLHAGPTQSGGASVAWLGVLLGRSGEEVSGLAARSAPARPGPIFLPHLQGERAPLWDIEARGSFAGLDASVGASELSRSVLEGVAFSARLLTEALERSSGVFAKRLKHAGGGARSDVWCQIRADVLGRSIDRVENLNSGVVGAAILAGTAAGVFPSIKEGSDCMVRPERTFAPNRALRDHYDEGFGRYTDLYARLKGFGRREKM